MNDFIKHYEKVSLSDKDVFKLLDGKVHIEVYPNLHKYQNLDQLLGPYGACVLLFEAQPQYGHWCAIFKINDELVEFFNPYGTINEGWPDDSLLYIPTGFRIKTHQYTPYLSLLLLSSQYELSYNDYQFQKHGNNIRTCGRHCVVRLWNKHLHLEEYKHLMDIECDKNNLNYDQLVTLLTI